MRLPAPKVILFNAGAIIVASAAVFAAVRSMLVTPTAAPCTERYLSMTAFALERGGVVLTAAELQAMSGGRDAGLIDNVAIVRKDGPSPLAIAVRLRRGPTGGTSFPWEPRAVSGKTSACLSYHVFFPADFDFGRGGKLPGFGSAEGAERGDGFAAPVVWRPKGGGNATVRVAKDGSAETSIAGREDFAFPRGRWVKLEQEVVLNALNSSDGILRVWIDGALGIDRTDVTYRSKPDVTISSVLADVHYAGGETTDSAPKDAKVWLSPFEIRW